jgi:hypothetical protein
MSAPVKAKARDQTQHTLNELEKEQQEECEIDQGQD